MSHMPCEKKTRKPGAGRKAKPPGQRDGTPGLGMEVDVTTTMQRVNISANSAATSAVNSAISGTTGGVAYFTGPHSIASSFPLNTTPTPTVVPVSDGSGTLNAWGLNTAVNGTSGWVPSFTGTHSIGAGWQVSGTPTPYYIPVSNSAGNLDAWVTGPKTTGVFFTAGPTSTFTTTTDSSWSEFKTDTRTFSSSTGNVQVVFALTVPMFCNDALPSCARLIVDSTQVGASVCNIGGPTASPQVLRFRWLQLLGKFYRQGPTRFTYKPSPPMELAALAP